MTEKPPLKYYPSEDWLKKNGKFGNPNSVWANCGYCNTTFYLSDIPNGSLYLSVRDGPGYSSFKMENEKVGVHLAERWLHEEHIPKCIIHHKPKL